jgi:creatinine amidohydrolase/Fe(II)-dependent formamide hydrolase-like protein
MRDADTRDLAMAYEGESGPLTSRLSRRRRACALLPPLPEGPSLEHAENAAHEISAAATYRVARADIEESIGRLLSL